MEDLENFEQLEKIGIMLAGSPGSKFWPLSNSKVPEQFVHLLDDTTLFQKTYHLVNKQISNEDIFVVVNEKFKHLILEQSQVKADNIFTEPLMRQTAPALGLALTLIDDKYSDDTIICTFPSDQLIKNHEEFNLSLNVACQAAYELNALITIGIEPNAPAPHFGYIQYSEEQTDKKNNKISNELFDNGVRKSINFIEKPDEETAQRFINSGGFVWNSGMLIAKKSVIIAAYKKFMNYHYSKFQQIKQFYQTENYTSELENLYKTFNKISIDYGILENAANIYVVKSTFTWIDFNNWNELHKIFQKDAMDNVLMGNIIALDTNNSLVVSHEKPIAVMGVDDIVAVNTDNAILICKKSEAHKINDLVKLIKKNNIPIY